LVKTLPNYTCNARHDKVRHDKVRHVLETVDETRKYFYYFII
jgi:hypothetical protein